MKGEIWDFQPSWVIRDKEFYSDRLPISQWSLWRISLWKDGRILQFNNYWYSSPPIRPWWMSSPIDDFITTKHQTVLRPSKAVKSIETNIGLFSLKWMPHLKNTFLLSSNSLATSFWGLTFQSKGDERLITTGYGPNEHVHTVFFSVRDYK